VTQTKTNPAKTPIGAKWQSETFDVLFARGRKAIRESMAAHALLYGESMKKGDYHTAGVALVRLRYITCYGLGPLLRKPKVVIMVDYQGWQPGHAPVTKTKPSWYV
jgi:hypothetical protein